MGRYVYLEDEEIKRLNEDLEIFNPLTDDEIDKSIKDKLSQKPKTLEELGWSGEYEKKYNILLYSKNVRTLRKESICDASEIFNLKNKTIGGISIEDIEAILNKARELFKE